MTTGGAVSAVIAPERAIGCVVYCSTAIESPGVIVHYEGTRFSIGEPDGSVSKRCLAFTEAMVAGGLKCPVEPTTSGSSSWATSRSNPLSALTRATMAEMCEHRRPSATR